jgi:hypothetical protein
MGAAAGSPLAAVSPKLMGRKRKTRGPATPPRVVLSSVGEAKRINAMVDITLKTEEEILAFNVSDEALEIAAGTVSDNANFTFGVCTANQSGCPG